jgi:hypothetical protein
VGVVWSSQGESMQINDGSGSALAERRGADAMNFAI